MARSLLSREIRFLSCSVGVRPVTCRAKASSRKAVSCSFHTFQNFLAVPAVAYLTVFLLVAITICAN